MPYKDLEIRKQKHREISRNWRKNNLKQSRETQRNYYREHKEERINYSRKHSRIKAREMRERIRNLLGNQCEICHSKGKIIYHEIHGKPHPYGGLTFYRYILANIKDFKPLCITCHRRIHEFRKYFNNPLIRKFLKKMEEDIRK